MLCTTFLGVVERAEPLVLSLLSGEGIRGPVLGGWGELKDSQEGLLKSAGWGQAATRTASWLLARSGAGADHDR